MFGFSGPGSSSGGLYGVIERNHGFGQSISIGGESLPIPPNRVAFAARVREAVHGLRGSGIVAEMADLFAGTPVGRYFSEFLASEDADTGAGPSNAEPTEQAAAAEPEIGAPVPDDEDPEPFNPVEEIGVIAELVEGDRLYSPEDEVPEYDVPTPVASPQRLSPPPHSSDEE